MEGIQISGEGNGLWRVCKAAGKKFKIDIMGKNKLMAQLTEQLIYSSLLIGEYYF